MDCNQCKVAHAPHELRDGLCLDCCARELRKCAPILRLIEMHSSILNCNPHAYFEIGYTRITGWMAWICSNTREIDPNRTVIACGQGTTPQAACEAALTQPTPTPPDAEKGGAQ